MACGRHHYIFLIIMLLWTINPQTCQKKGGSADLRFVKYSLSGYYEFLLRRPPGGGSSEAARGKMESRKKTAGEAPTGGRSPTWECLRGHSPFIRPPQGWLRSSGGRRGHEKRLPAKRQNNFRSEATWGCLRGRSPFIRPPGGQLRRSRGRMGPRKEGD